MSFGWCHTIIDNYLQNTVIADPNFSRREHLFANQNVNNIPVNMDQNNGESSDVSYVNDHHVKEIADNFYPQCLHTIN